MVVFTEANPVSVGNATKKGHYDTVHDNTLYLLDNLYTSTPSIVYGLRMRTHPDKDKAAAQIMLVRAEEIIMRSATSKLDGQRVGSWDRLTIDLAAAVGAGGWDAGAEAASIWIQPHAIRKSSDGTKGLIAHRMKDYFLDEDTLGGGADDTSYAMRDDAARLEIAQGFEIDTTGAGTRENGQVPFVVLKMAKVGTPTGRVWVELRANNAGDPAASVLATSDKMDVSRLSTTAYKVAFVFRTPVALQPTTTRYHLVLNGDFTVNASNYVVWRGDGSSPGYTRGEAKRYTGAAWTALTADMALEVYVTRNDTALVLPSGYDQYAPLLPFYNDSGSNLIPQIVKNRTAHPLATQPIISVTAVALTPALIDASAFIPPGPVTFWGHSNPQAANVDVKVAPVPDGYSLTGGSRDGGMIRSYSGVTGDARVDMGWIETEAQRFYGSAAGGTGDVYLLGFSLDG